LGLLSLAIVALLWPLIADGSEAAPTHARAALRWTPDTVRLVACYGAFGFGYIIPATYLPAMAKALVHDPLAFGWAWPVFGATAAAAAGEATAPLVVAALAGRPHGFALALAVAAIALVASAVALATRERPCPT